MTSPDNSHSFLEQDLIDLPELFRTFKFYRWGIFGITLLSLAGSALYALSLPKIYRATASVLIETGKDRTVAIQDVYDPDAGTAEYNYTQNELLRSRELLVPMIDKLGLIATPEFMQKEKQASRFEQMDWKRWLPFLPEEAELDLSEEEQAVRQKEQVISKIADDHLFVETVRGTRIIKIHFESESPRTAADAANTISDLYLESGLRTRLDATKRATSWLTERLEEIRKDLEKSEQALQRYREQEKVVSVGTTRGLSEQELVDYSQRAREAQKRKTELASAYAKVLEAGNDEARLKNISVLLLDPGIQKANESMLAAQEIVKQLQERYGAKHPNMATAQARLQAAQSAYREQLRIAAQGIKAEYEIAQENERGMSNLVAGAKERLRLLDRKEYDRSVLEREVQSNRQLYEVFLNRFKETDQTTDYEKLDARIIDRATPPTAAYKPNVRRYVLIGGAAGLLVALMLALLRHMLNEEVRSVEDLERITRLPVLSVLPLVGGISVKRNLAKQFLEKPHTAFGEGIRSIRSALQLLDVDKKFKSFMITSSVPQEGKSSVSATLALSFGAMERVLLIEADLRLPSLKKLFGLPDQSQGLTDVLAGTITLDQAVVRYGDSNVYVLPAGTLTKYPSELLGSAAFKKLTEILPAKFDRVLYDTPPCHAASDALLLSRMVNGVIFVVKSDATSRRSVCNALKQLRTVSAPLVGTVINQVNVKRNPHYHDGYYYAYGYYGKS